MMVNEVERGVESLCGASDLYILPRSSDAVRPQRRL